MNFSLIKEKIREHRFTLFLRVSFQLFDELKILSKSLGASGTHQSKSKIEAKIKIIFHSIEKGLALPNPRTGFGVPKIENLMKEIAYYYSQYGFNDFLIAPLATIESYIKFNKSRNQFDENLETTFNKLINTFKTNNIEFSGGGITHFHKSELVDDSLHRYTIFKEIVNTRHSIRTFSGEKIDIEIINKGLELARRTPSACNRQPWKVYVYKNDELKKALLSFQGGNSGFTDEIDTALLITSDYNQYFVGEIHQAYIDGALFALTLIYAYHSLNLGVIPLTNGLKSKQIKQMQKKFKIPFNEVPIMMLGLGYLKNEFDVAISQRKNYDSFTKYFF